VVLGGVLLAGIMETTAGPAVGAARTAPIWIRVDDPVVPEGAPGSSATADFTVSLSSAPGPGQSASVKVATANGSATVGSDYTAVPATTLTFGPGQRTRTVPVTVLGDAAKEPNETIRLNLSAASSGTVISDSQGSATIVDDDRVNPAPLPPLYVGDAWVVEAAGAEASAVFPLWLGRASTSAVTVQVATADKSATAGSDYRSVATTTITFAPGETARTATVAVLGDRTKEANETFTLGLASAAGATIADAKGLATIVDGPAWGPATFEDVTNTSGLGALGSAYSHAAAWGDVNGDGRPDLFVGTFTDKARTDGQDPSPNRLFLNTGNGFVSAAQPAVETRGRTSGAVFADLDDDGDLDLYVSNNRKVLASSTAEQLDPSRLFRNDGGTFVDVTDASGVAVADRNGRSVGVLDYDGDGRLDLYVVADSLTGGGTRVSRLLHNTGGLHFADATALAGLPTNLAGLGVAVGDLDGDGWPDLVTTGGVTASGSYAKAYLFLNRRDGTFVDITPPDLAWTPHTNEDWTAGAAVGDINRDGRLDLVVTDHFGSAPDFPVAPRVYLNRGNRPDGTPILDELHDAGLAPIPAKAPHVEIVDMDNDGWPDLYVSVLLQTANGPAPYVYLQRRTSTGDPSFTAPTGSVSSYAPGGPTADYDGDGRADVLMEGFDVSVAPSLLHNTTAGTGHWLAVRLLGPAPNRFGIGARVAVYRSGLLGRPEGLLGTAEIGTGNGFSSASPALARFGLGDAAAVDVAVTYPFGGPTVTRTAVPANQVVTLSR
jgi:hypothetical protein